MIVLIIICIVGFINHTNCLEREYTRLSPQHGSNTGNSVNTFMCPANGAILAIQYSTQRFFTGLTFFCSSVNGKRVYGTYGRNIGIAGQFFCPRGQYISSLYGTSGTSLSGFGVRCRPISATDLKGNGTEINFNSGSNTGKVAGGTDGSAFPKFDDWAYSNGGRPIGAKIWTSANQVEAVQLVYTNAPVEVNTNSDYMEKSTTVYGTQTGQMALFDCPHEGAVTALRTKTVGGRLTSMQLVCTAGVGSTTTQEMGRSFGESTVGTQTVQCPPGTIVGAFHGSYDTVINSVGVRCAENNVTGDSPLYDAVGVNSGTAFDDGSYSYKGWRPVLFKIFYDSNGINGMQIKYANAPVSTNCKVTKIEVLDTTVQAVSDGTEVVGMAVGTSCWEDSQQLIHLECSRQVSESVIIDTTDGGDINWGTTLSVTATGSVNVFGAKAEVSVGLAQSAGGSKQWSTTNATSTSVTTGQTAGIEITYATPGACAVIGFVDRYKIDRDNVPCKLHYECESGQIPYELATIKIKSTTYGNAYFEDYRFKYTNMAACTNESRACVKSLNANSIAVDTKSFADQFYNCKV